MVVCPPQGFISMGHQKAGKRGRAVLSEEPSGNAKKKVTWASAEEETQQALTQFAPLKHPPSQPEDDEASLDSSQGDDHSSDEESEPASSGEDDGDSVSGDDDDDDEFAGGKSMRRSQPHITKHFG